MPSPHVDDEKGKKAMIYKARKDRRKKKDRKKEQRKQKKENHIFRACPKRIYGDIPRSYLSPFFTLRPNISAQDQTSSLSCTLQIHCLGYVDLDPFPFWILVKLGPYSCQNRDPT